MPCPSTSPKTFFFGPDQKINCIYFLHKTFCNNKTSEFSSFGLAHYENPYLAWHKTFGSAQNILGPVEGRGTRVFNSITTINMLFRENMKVTISFQ